MSKAKGGSKNIKALIRLVIPAAGAKPAPPVGPALGQAGVNIMQFCKDFNAKTESLKPGTPVPVRITAFEDRSFEYDMKTPPVSYFIKQALGKDTLAKQPGHETVGQLSIRHILYIAKIKQLDMPHVSLLGLCKSIIGSCRSMGVEVVR